MTAQDIATPDTGSDAAEAIAEMAAMSAEDADTEGHSFGLLLGMKALGQAREADARARRKMPDERLRPLSKTWPRLRPHKKP
jgi:hypothetical protein